MTKDLTTNTKGLKNGARETRVQVDPRIHYIQPASQSGPGFADMEQYYSEIVPFLTNITRDNKVSEDMAADFMLHEQGKKLNVKHSKAYFQFFTNPDILPKILNTTDFDLIIAEEHSLLPVSTVAYRSGIPIIVLSCASDMRGARMRLALPYLLSSEAGFIGSVPALKLPTFRDRLDAVLNMYNIISFWMNDVIAGIMDEYLVPFGIHDLSQLSENVVMTFINDHPAVSFPYLAPPNAVYLGGLHLTEHSQLQPLTGLLAEFLESCSQDNVIYVSFGAYLRDLDNLPWLGLFLEYLASLDACIIFKAKSGINSASLNQDKFLVLPWVPQKDLLGSGKLTMFVSHCGQNGRLEAIYYNVPILCIPLFADQLLNAYYIQRHGLGGMLFKEHLSKESLSRVTSNIIENREEIVSNQAKAAYVMKNEPGVGKEAVLFYVNLLAEHGNLDYLRNRIIEKQWTYEIYNIDVMVVIFIFGLLLIGIGIKCFLFLVRVGISKIRKS